MRCQQSTVYTAETSVPPGRRFVSRDEVQEYVDRLMWTYPRWRDDFSQVRRIEAHTRSGAKGSVGFFDASRGAGLIDMGHDNELIVLHEVAHVLCDARYGSQSHDPWFARIYLELVCTAMGSEAYVSLWSAFKQLGVDCDTDDAGCAQTRCMR